MYGEQQAVLQQADAEAAAADHPLSLLGLITSRAEQYRVVIRDMLAAVHAASSAFAAAVKESHLHSELSRVHDDYARTVPSRMIVVSTEEQMAWLYQDGTVIYSTPVTTGGPDLPTDHGVFHIDWKQSPFTFHSPWPPSSPYYYPPTQVQYWMPFNGGEGLHDASWRSNFGPGSNFAPTDLGTGNSILGTHGCVNLPLSAAQLIWDWAPVGTMVVVV
jgi:lipoprotein-anchoring transpeptidase ErfK/SrfK